MVAQVKKYDSMLAIEKRVQELEREVNQLSSELEERKRLEETLRESEYRLRSMAEGTPMIIWVTNAAGNIEFINKAYTEFFGVTLAVVQSIGWQMIVHPDDQVAYVGEYLFCLQQHHPFHAQARIYRSNGKWRWIESYGQPRFSESGEYLGMAGSSLDITDRIEVEEALRESELKFHSAFHNAAIGFSMAAPGGRLMDTNEAYCRLTGYSRMELLDLDEFQLIHPRDVENNIRLIGQLLANETHSCVIEHRYIRKDGQPVWVRKSVSAVSNSKGEPRFVISLVEQLGRRRPNRIRNASKTHAE